MSNKDRTEIIFNTLIYITFTTICILVLLALIFGS